MVDALTKWTILVPIKDKTAEELTRADIKLVGHVRKAGATLCKHVMDNEASKAMKWLICDKYKMKLELVPSGNHGLNAVKIAS